MKLVGGESFHRGPEYGKMYWDNWKGVGVQRSLSSQLSGEEPPPEVLHLDVPESSHSQPAQHFIHSLLQTRLSSQNSASGVDHTPRLQQPQAGSLPGPPLPPTTPLLLHTSVSQLSPPGRPPLKSHPLLLPLDQRGQLSAPLTSTISKRVFTEPLPHQPFPLFISSPHC